MTLRLIACAGASLVALAGASAVAQGRGGAGSATYWMSAETKSGMVGAMGGGNAAAMQAMMSGGSPPRFSRDLRLQLGTGQRPAGGAHQAEHAPPAALRAGAVLPLVTPQTAPATTLPANFERPRGRILLYWGCGERARAGQPVVIDFATLTSGRAPAAFTAANIPTLNAPAPGRNTSYGEWPNARSEARIPINGSLVGEHVVRGNYTPELRFTVGGTHDFMAPVTLTANRAAPSGAFPLAWAPVPGARAWFASTIGSAGNGDMVMWTSSETQMTPIGHVFDAVSGDQLQRLITQRVLMGPQASSCTVPAEVARAASSSLLTLTAIGGEGIYTQPRPAGASASWRPDWTARLRLKSSYMSPLGMDVSDMNGGSDDDREAAPRRNPQQPERPGDAIRRGIGRIFGGG